MILKSSYKIKLYSKNVSVAATTTFIRENLLRKLKHLIIKTVLLNTAQLDPFRIFYQRENVAILVLLDHYKYVLLEEFLDY